MNKNKNEVINSGIGVLNVRTVSVLLSGSEGSGLNHLAVGVAQKVRNGDRIVLTVRKWNMYLLGIKIEISWENDNVCKNVGA